MSLRRKMRAIMALVAAYAVALQAIFLAIGGLLAGPTDLGPPLWTNSLCESLRPGTTRPASSGHEHDCSAACAVCCCSAPTEPASAPATAHERALAGLIAAAAVIVPTRQFNARRAHRSRAPPLG